ncbi:MULTISPECIES: tetratricopeptide repeat protein [Nocardiaceae]|uniref:Tetratricopeptide repeat protein n=1 Tax=Rhodococcoides kroppenstedtii TaxID=293050 RepID=A0ABS7NYJ0_9NOCA|nr:MULTISPECIES: tetratricopeptide repeat protein [Rhodococcus]AMY18239.1 Thioredoxin C-1 [Rhodococcus sp. PBTS 1]MBY6314819.1 tetratricopeptide repeat protein [Rhodococcus kroppenstedtii]MBY6322613.1 tetratricopeptide repeat protein [Rhodococcus kroppenstedtii]MBY6401417.1 tetratricopeptide repeat protein [Rhodococcus kroppenstedtii]
MSGAVDLSALKAKAEAAAAPPAPTGAGGVPVVVAVTEPDFEAEVLVRSNQVPVIVNLLSPRSPGSLQLTRTLEALAAEGNGTWILANVDVDVSPRIAQAFGVQAVPTLVAVAAGQPLADLQGPQPEENLRQWLAAIAQAVEGKLTGPVGETGPAPEPEDPRFDAAESALAEGDLAGAEAAFQAIVDAEPQNKQALNGVRQVRFLARTQSIPDDVLEQADADPADVELGLQAADALLYQQRTEESFARLVDLVRRTAGDDRARVRARLLELFDLFDAADPLVVAARRKLASALF